MQYLNFTSLFFDRGKKYGVGEISFDLITSETHTFTSEVTTHAIQDGSEISDNVSLSAESGTINGLISNYSIKTRLLKSNRSKDVFEALIALWKSKTPVKIITVMRTYENAIITSMPFTRDNEQGEMLPIQISFKVIKIVKLEAVSAELDLSTDLNTEQGKQVAPEKAVGDTIAIDSGNLTTILKAGK